jgi:L-fuconolactonase
MSIQANRREFLAAAAGSALAASTGPLSAAELAPLPIVDTHVHLWDRKRFHLAWLEGAPALQRDYSWDDYKRATEGYHVVHAIYMEVDVDLSQQEQEARYVADLCRAGTTPLAAAVISGRPAADGFAAYIKPLAKLDVIKGVRQVLHGPGTPPGYCLDPAFIRGIRLLGELGLSFDLCMRSAELGDGAKLAEACPGTQFILDHCGNADVFATDLSAWKRDIAALARRPNVSCKVSGIIASTKGRTWRPADLAPVVNHVLTEFGPDRVVFGGDWPVCTLGAPLAEWIQALRELTSAQSHDRQRKLFHDNALRVYRLEPRRPGAIE